MTIAMKGWSTIMPIRMTATASMNMPRQIWKASRMFTFTGMHQ